MERKVIVTVKEGRVRGFKTKSAYSGTEYYSFLGIPYGQSTAGSARFKDPVEAKPWKNVLDGTTEREGCFQYSLAKNQITGSEDCLYNNIHTPQIPEPGDQLKPVIALIHPGGFAHGSAETSYFGSPDYFIHRDVVYVGITHRLHILGYLNLGLEECSGNQAFKDITLSLQWVRNNISAFGGDPNNVTIIGSSSGSAIVHGLLLFSKAKGLFHKAIMMGVHALNPTLFAVNDHKKKAYETAEQLGYKKVAEKDEKKLLSFYKRLPLDKFITLRLEMTLQQGMQLFPSSPFISTPENEPLLEGDPLLSSRTSRVPLMFGMCEREAAMGFTRLFQKSCKEYFYKSYRQNEWAWGREITEDEVQEIKKEIDEFYFKGGSLESATLEDKVNIQTDIAYSNIYKTLLDIISSDLPSSVYVYKFQFEGQVFTMKRRIQPLLDQKLDGTYHADDFGYWAHIKGLYGMKSPTSNQQTREIIDKFTKLITTFARTGNPNYEGLEVNWKPTTPEKPCHLIINDQLEVVDSKLNGDRMLFWENIIEKYGKRSPDKE